MIQSLGVIILMGLPVQSNQMGKTFKFLIKESFFHLNLYILGITYMMLYFIKLCEKQECPQTVCWNLTLEFKTDFFYFHLNVAITSYHITHFRKCFNCKGIELENNYFCSKVMPYLSKYTTIKQWQLQAKAETKENIGTIFSCCHVLTFIRQIR